MHDYSEFFKKVCVYLEQAAIGETEIEGAQEVINITPFGYSVDAGNVDDSMSDNVILIMDRYMDEPFIRFIVIIAYNDMTYYQNSFRSIDDVFNFIDNVSSGSIYVPNDQDADDYEDWEYEEMNQNFSGYNVLKDIFEAVLTTCYDYKVEDHQ